MEKQLRLPGRHGNAGGLRDDGFPLYVCTSKQHRFATRILDHFELTPFFKAIYGDKLEYASHSKIDLLARLVAEHQLETHSTWMVGDRIFDIEAARGNNLPCLFAGWGYGQAGEGERADAVAPTPADVRAIAASASDARRHEA